MLQKNISCINAFRLLQIFFVLMTATAVNAQIYQHNFGTATLTANPYTAAPSVLHADLSGSVWTSSVSVFSDLAGDTGKSLSIAMGSASPETLTLTFNVTAGRAVNIDSFNFWRRRSNSGPQNWSMTINGINAGAGTNPTTGAAIGTTPVATAVTGLTGTVTVVITVSNGRAGGTFRLDDFTLNGSVYSTCAATVTSFLPATAPVGTIVTINGNNLTGTTSVKFGTATTTDLTVVSNTQLLARVPAAATTGPVTVINGCEGVSPAAFTILASNCASIGTDVYISELYDEEAGSGGAIELYNPTNSTIVFDGSYVLKRYGDITDTTTTPAYTLTLTGSIGPGMTYLVAGNNPVNCTVTTAIGYTSGFNGNDKFELVKNGVVLDLVHVPFTAPGFTLIRQANAIAPSAAYNINEWNNSETEDCSTLGSHTAVSVTAPTVTQPVSQTACENGSATFTVAVTPATGLTYQWKMLNASGIWVNVVNNANYAGATTNTLTVNLVPLSLDNTQYYCEITSASCTILTNAVQLEVETAPAAPTVTIVQPTCLLPTGIITIDNPVAGLTYTINGVTGITLAGLAPDTYTITVQNAAGCTTTATATITIAPLAPATPAVTVTQPTCTTATGSITIDSPVAGLIYTINGIAGTTLTGLAPDTYTITVQNIAGCVTTTTVVINAAPVAPAVPVVIVTQPTCATPTGSITIDGPVAGLIYTIHGVTGTTLDGLAPDTYTITVQTADGCTATTTATINAAPNAPAVPTLTIAQPTCTVATGTITIDNPEAGVTYSINGDAGTTFTGLAQGSYTVNIINAAGCTAVTSTIVINAAPATPDAPVVTVTQADCTTATGTITIDAPQAGVTYSINGNTGTTFTGLAAGSYTVIAQNAEGCTAATSDIVINEQSVPVIVRNQGCTTTFAGTSYLLTIAAFNNSFDINNATIQWSLNGNVLPYNGTTFNVTEYVAVNSIDPSQFPLEFIATVTVGGGCETVAAFVVESSFCTIPKGISPNDDNKNDNFNLTGLNVMNLQIFNRYGKTVYSKNNYTNEWAGQTDDNKELPTGTYYYVIELTNGNVETGWVYLNRQS